MDGIEGLSRRRLLGLAAGASAAFVGGCTGDDGTDDEGDGGSDGADEWDDVTEIGLEGDTGGWTGVEPDAIEGETNPTLYLTAGAEYEITWENADGVPHDLVIRDGDGEELEATETLREPGERATLEFEATGGMDEYICTYHPTAMIGDVDV